MHQKFGEKQKALDHYNKSLQLYKEIGDKTGEQEMLGKIESMR
jgi:hypothetical protein